MKSSAVWINSQVSNKMAQTTEKVQNCWRSYACYRVQLTLKKMFYKKTQCSTKLKLFHCYLIALAQGENNSTCLLLSSIYTLYDTSRYLIHIFFASLRRILKPTKLLIPIASYQPWTKRDYSIASRRNFYDNKPTSQALKQVLVH